MVKRSGKTVSVGYSKKKKMLVISEPMTSFIPAYLYYVCQNLETEHKIKIETVYFTKENEEVLKNALKGVRDWDKLYEEEENG